MLWTYNLNYFDFLNQATRDFEGKLDTVIELMKDGFGLKNIQVKGFDKDKEEIDLIVKVKSLIGKKNFYGVPLEISELNNRSTNNIKKRMV